MTVYHEVTGEAWEIDPRDRKHVLHRGGRWIQRDWPNTVYLSRSNYMKVNPSRVRAALKHFFRLMSDVERKRLAEEIASGVRPLVGDMSEYGYTYGGKSDPILLAALDQEDCARIYKSLLGRPFDGMGFPWWLAQSRVCDVKEAINAVV